MLAATSMMTARVEVAVSPFWAHSIALASSASNRPSISLSASKI
jgi:hypothetical protein